jgi:hypothetical protein
MDRWLQIEAHCWRKEAELPMGHLVAEIRKQEYLALYSVRVEVCLAAAHLPQHVTKTALGFLNVAAAQLVCNRLIAELVTLSLVAQSRDGPAGRRAEEQPPREAASDRVRRETTARAQALRNDPGQQTEDDRGAAVR